MYDICQLEDKITKNQGFNGIRSRDLRDTGAMLYQLSYEATHWERGQFIEFISPVRTEMMWSIYETMKQKKLENLLRWSFFTLIYNRSSDVWIVSYILHIIVSRGRTNDKISSKNILEIKPIDYRDRRVRQLYKRIRW